MHLSILVFYAIFLPHEFRRVRCDAMQFPLDADAKIFLKKQSCNNTKKRKTSRGPFVDAILAHFLTNFFYDGKLLLLSGTEM